MELQQPMSKPKQGNRIHALCASSPFWVALLCVFLIGACSTVPTPAARRQHADELAAAAGWSPLLIPAGKFTLAAYRSPVQTPGAALTIYIEGDGAAWLNRSTPSADPTPVHATALELALRHPGGTVYLARPCQFVAGADRHGCQLAYWTEARFASAVIESTSMAIDALKMRVGAQRVILVGYSGGGAVAALVASRRNDVDRLVTVAGNLDHTVWTQLHGVEPLTGSLNPADSWQQLVSIPQVHFVGAQDKVINKEVALSFRARFPIEQQPKVVIVPEFDHQCCWARDWPQLLEQ
jgi:hypothetical protein